MLVYRIAKQEYIDDLSGKGASLFGGRWNPKGFHLLYTSGSVSLVSLEFMAHNYHILPSNIVSLAEIEIEVTDSIMELDVLKLPKDWNETTYTPSSTQKRGEKFIKESNYYMLKVPSAIVPMEFNYLINPSHKNHLKTKVRQIIHPYKLDKRLFNLY